MAVLAKNLRAAALVFGMTVALLAAGCGKKEGVGEGSGAVGSTLRWEQDDEVEVELELAAKDEIIAVGRPSDTIVTAIAKSGKAYVLDLDAEELEEIPPFSKFDQKKVKSFTVSKAYVWLLFTGDGQVGRNKAPPDASNKFEVTKVSLEEVVDDAAELTPLAATESQVFFFGEEALIVCTFEGSSINIKKIPLPDAGLLKGETPLGAGAVGDAEDKLGFWLMTSKRRLLLDTRAGAARWKGENVVLDYEDEEPAFLTLAFEQNGKKIEQVGSVIGLFDGNTLRSMSSPKSR